MTRAVVRLPSARGWPNLDLTFHERAIHAATTEVGRQFRKTLEHDLTRIRGTPLPSGMGIPLLVRAGSRRDLGDFARAYHRCVETVARAWSASDVVRRVVVLPPELTGIVEADRASGSPRIHQCRLDLTLQPDGGFSVLETNANCPGGILLTGWASREWRAYLTGLGLGIPPPLEQETVRWKASWFLREAEASTGEVPLFVPLLRWEGGNRLSLPGLAEEFRGLGVDAVEADPRELAPVADGSLSLRGRRVRHAYWKLGIRHLGKVREEVDTILAAVGRGDLFVQNGITGRFIGDNKLCLAVLSDPTFASMFDPEDISTVRPHLPWSRNAADCTAEQLCDIRSKPLEYVLKRPLDTRGNGVVMGPESESRKTWERAVDRAIRERWLVQRYSLTAQLETYASDQRVCRRHDLSLGLADGRVISAMSRSSSELRTNVALTGCLHPVFMGA